MSQSHPIEDSDLDLKIVDVPDTRHQCDFNLEVIIFKS